MTTEADNLVERGADRLQELSDVAAARNGLVAKLAAPLAEDAAFLRKLKPSLIGARAKGEAPAAPSGPQLGARPASKTHGGGPNPFVVAGVALAAGIFLAKWIDWRGHAHPRR